MTAVDVVRGYYEAIDGGRYDRLADQLDPAFVQVRPDRTIDGRDAFVQFMREERPLTDTTHELRRLTATDDRVVAEGTLLDGEGDPLFQFADVHELDDDAIVRLRTYTA